MDVKKEDMMGGMMPDMMDDPGFIMDGHTPEILLRKLAETERMEAALYVQIAQAVPSEELRRIILHKARHERRQARMLFELSRHFGMMLDDPLDEPMPYSAGEGKEKK